MSANFEFVYRPQGQTLDDYIMSTAQRTFICGPLGSGKTNASCWKLFRAICAQQPDRDGVRRTRALAVRNTYPDLFGTTVKDWRAMFDDLGKFNMGGKTPPTHYLSFRLDDGTQVESEVIFLALDREDHVKKLRGQQITFCWLNEVKELTWSVVEMLDLRMGRYPEYPTWYGIWGDTNAPDTDHWYYRLAEESKPDGWVFFKQPGGVMRAAADKPWVVNPAAENTKNLPRDYYKNGVQGKSDAWILVNLANEYGFVADGKPIYPDYRDSIHCKPFDLVPGIPLHIGLDFGLTPAAQIGQRLATGQWRVRHEVVTTDTGVIRFARQLREFVALHCKGFQIGTISGDPAGDQRQVGDSEERTVFQLLAANGINAVPAPGNNDFAMRTEAVSSALRRMIDGEPGYLLHPDCKVTRKGMQGGYHFRRMKVSGDERYQDRPAKNASSHPCEAGQYMMLGAGVGAEMLTVTSKEAEEDAAEYRRRRGKR